MRIVAVSDTHGCPKRLGEVPAGDVFIHAGDLLRCGSIDQLEPVADWLHQLPHQHKLVVAGNHDWCFQRERRLAVGLISATATYLEDSYVEIDGVKFWGSPWQPEFLDWAFNLPRGTALAQKWSLIPDDVDVLIIHGPPRGIGDKCGNGREGCDDLRAAVHRVRISESMTVASVPERTSGDLATLPDAPVLIKS